MVLVVHIDQLTAERSVDGDGLYETWVGTDAFMHDHGRALHIAVRLLKLFEGRGENIRMHLQGAEKLLQSTIESCIEEIKRLRLEDEGIPAPETFELRPLSNYRFDDT